MKGVALALGILILLGSCQRKSEELFREDLSTLHCEGEGEGYLNALCLFKQGNFEGVLRRMDSLKSARALSSKENIHYWKALSHLKVGQKQKAIQEIRLLPPSYVLRHVLNAPDFDDLSSEEDYRHWKTKLRQGFSPWTMFYLFVALGGLFLSLAVFFKRTSIEMGRRWLALMVFSFSMIILIYDLSWTGYAITFPYLTGGWKIFTLLIGPSLFLYLKEIYENEEEPPSKYWVHFIVPVLSLLLCSGFFISHFGYDLPWALDLFKIGGSNFLLVAHLVYYYALINHYTYSEVNMDDNIAVWIQFLKVGYVIFIVGFTLYFVLYSASFFNRSWDYFVSFIMSVGILVVAYFSLIQKRIFRSEPIDNFLLPNPGLKGADDLLLLNLKTHLEGIFENEQIFKENELRLDDLAGYLSVSRHQLSEVINKHYGVHFFEFVNAYRLQYVLKLLHQDRSGKMTIQQMAYEAGFNNKTSFNKYFKKKMGCTPSEYRLMLKKEDVQNF